MSNWAKFAMVAAAVVGTSLAGANTLPGYQMRFLVAPLLGMTTWAETSSAPTKPGSLAKDALPQGTPVARVEDYCMALAWAPDGRLAYATRHVYPFRSIEIQRDNIWVLAPDGKSKRIVNGETLVQGPQGFSYSVRALRWSPDGSHLTAELLTAALADRGRSTREGEMTLMLDQNGKEIKVTHGDSAIPDAMNATWLADNASLVYVMRPDPDSLLFHVGLTRPSVGMGGVIFFEHWFSAAAWNAKENVAVAIERNTSLTGPPRLVVLDLAKESARELARLGGYYGGLAISPSGTKAAYYGDPGEIEFRDLELPERMARVRAPFGNFQWAPDEKQLLLKRATERKPGDLVWVDVPELKAGATEGDTPTGRMRPALGGISVRDFEVSPDGKQIAVIEPDRRILSVYVLR